MSQTKLVLSLAVTLNEMPSGIDILCLEIAGDDDHDRSRALRPALGCFGESVPLNRGELNVRHFLALQMGNLAEALLVENSWSKNFDNEMNRQKWVQHRNFLDRKEEP